MKKLMVVAAIALAASASFGATYKWQTKTGQAHYDGYTGATSPNKTGAADTPSYGVSVYLFVAESSELSEGYSAFTQQQLLNALNADNGKTMAEKWAALTTDSETKQAIVSTTMKSTGVINAVNSFTYEGVEAGVNKKLYAYEAILVQDGDKSWVYISDEVNAGAQTGSTPQMQFTSTLTSTSKLRTEATTFEGSKWYAVGAAVPEPTSAMLLLLGVAGLALKRKRA